MTVTVPRDRHGLGPADSESDARHGRRPGAAAGPVPGHRGTAGAGVTATRPGPCRASDRERPENMTIRHSHDRPPGSHHHAAGQCGSHRAAAAVTARHDSEWADAATWLTVPISGS